MRRWRRAVGACVGILAALVLSTSALGASPWLTIREQGVGALSVHSACTDNGDGTMACESELLQVLVGKLKVSGSRTEHTDEVCYGRVTATVTSDGEDLISGDARVGCAFDTHAIRIRGLSSISVRTIDIELTALTCDETTCLDASGGHVSVSAKWTGVGRSFSSHSRFRVDDGGCFDISSSSGRAREATFAGWADGEAISSDDAQVASGSFLLRTSCLGELP